MLDLQQAFERHLVRSRFFTTHDQVVVAVSTGVDSMVLLDLLQNLPLNKRPQIIVAHMNHELRAQSKVEEQFIRQYCQQHDLPLEVAHWPQKRHPQKGVENAARKARYRFFRTVMDKTGAQFLLTAHHQNDLAETMLMKMVRGGQLSQLVGIHDRRPFASGTLVRPLLPFSKDQLREYAQARHLKWYEDQTNRDLGIQRNRYRHEIIPLLEKENPQLLAHLTSYHQQLTELLAWREQVVASELEKSTDIQGKLNLKVALTNKPLIQREIVRQWLNSHHVYDVKEQQLGEVLVALKNERKPQQMIELPHHYVLEKNYSTCTIKKSDNPLVDLQKPQEHVIELEQWYQVNLENVMAMSVAKSFFKDNVELTPQWFAPQDFPLRLRLWQKGDRIRLKNGHHQSVKRILINQKVPQQERDQQLVLVNAFDEVVWVVDRKWSWRKRPIDFQRTWQLRFIGIKNKEKNR